MIPEIRTFSAAFAPKPIRAPCPKPHVTEESGLFGQGTARRSAEGHDIVESARSKRYDLGVVTHQEGFEDSIGICIRLGHQ